MILSDLCGINITAHIFIPAGNTPSEPRRKMCSVHVFRWDEIRSLFRLMGEILFLPKSVVAQSHEAEFAEGIDPFRQAG